MRTNYSLLLGAALLLSTLLPAQKIIDKDISFNYIRLPKEPLGRSFGNYQSYVVAAYAADNAKLKADWEKKKGEADAQYQMDLAMWSQKDKAAQDKYDKEMDTYNKKSTAQKMLDKNLLNEGKPVRQIIPEPYKNIPPEPKYKKEYDSNLLSSYIKLDGFKNAGDNAVIITVTLYGFEGVMPQMMTTQKSVVEKGVSHNVTMYHYETSYKQPMSVKVECPGKGVVLNQSMEQFNNYTVEKTAESEQPPGSMNGEQHLKDLEQSSMTTNLKIINDLINEKFGYCKATRTTVLYCSESKKADYSDLKTAFDNALTAYNTMLDDKAAAVTKLKTAIDIWMKAVGEASMTDKKARINGEVGAMMELNLAEAFMWMDNYPDAETHMTKVGMMDPSRRMRHHGEEVAAMIKIQKSLFNANK